MYKCLLLVAVCLPAILGQALPVSQCNGRGVHPESVTVEGCTSLPCEVRRGDVVVMRQTFVADRNVQSFRPFVRATAGGVTVPYPLPEELRDGCSTIEQGGCPISAGQRIVYRFNFPMDNTYPPVEVLVELTLQDADSNNFACFILPIQVRLRG